MPNEVLTIEAAFANPVQFIGWRLTVPGREPLLVWADQSLPGFRSGEEFVADIGQTITYHKLPAVEATCRNCRFWAPQLSLCGKRFVDVPNDVREFKPNTMRVSVWPGGMGPGQSVYSVFTGPDFGCVHFEQSTVAAPQDNWEPLDNCSIPSTSIVDARA